MRNMGIGQGSTGESSLPTLSPLRQRRGLVLITGQPSTARGRYKPTRVPSQVCLTQDTRLYPVDPDISLSYVICSKKLTLVKQTSLNLCLSHVKLFEGPIPVSKVLGPLIFHFIVGKFVSRFLVSELPTVSEKLCCQSPVLSVKPDLW